MNEIAILMAAGMGTRMRPITEKIPKPMVKVYGTPMIETVIEGLKKRGVDEIILVTGYLGECFLPLKEKYDLTIVENKEYKTINNISSIHSVLSYMGAADCFICEADLYVADPELFQGDFDKSCYFGKMVEGHSDDWVFDQDENGRITRVGKGGDDRYNMCGVSYFLKDDAKKIGVAIAEAYKKPGYEELFWDDIVNRQLDKVNLTVHPVGNDQIVEIDTVVELEAVDPNYRNYL